MSYRAAKSVASKGDAYRAAYAMYHDYPWPKLTFELGEYAELVAEEAEGHSAIIAYADNGMQVGWLCISDVTFDIHVKGMGIVVHHTVVNPNHRAALRVLLRELRSYCRSLGLQWYHITHRTGELTFRSQFHYL